MIESETHDAAKVVQAAMIGTIDREGIRKLRCFEEDDAATVIQSCVNGRFSRLSAAGLIQRAKLRLCAGVLGMDARQDVAELKVLHAAPLKLNEAKAKLIKSILLRIQRLQFGTALTAWTLSMTASKTVELQEATEKHVVLEAEVGLELESELGFAMRG